MVEFFDKWAAYILAGVTGIGGVIWGMKRAEISNSYRLGQIEKEIREIKAAMEKDFAHVDLRIKATEMQGTNADISLARIQATLDNVLEYLQDLKSEIRGKADK